MFVKVKKFLVDVYMKACTLNFMEMLPKKF